ncbi:aldehyde dehydrogenase family protein [Clostridium aminobutyricum]|uniref:Aldehyde dehydrogenase family protein n=1 Tax=Clostridium aminobutyricum TaxID=33953 RepID=A0A939D7P9_CLOAM|nr:aldehyde dehydrogenase family protein [Clostridium aminobutyricum]MBN7772620.1 aldehyde dehydrogenase family protein [Clostridium aminobutyricum]
MTQTLDPSKAYIAEYIDRAKKAQAEFEKMTQEQLDQAVRTIGKVVFDNAAYLAEIAVEETGMGNYQDKVIKNQMKAKIIWNSLKGKKSKGIIERDEVTGITKIAKPVGIVGAITPCTNPIVTPMSNAMFALKGGNAIIITPHHKAIRCSTKTVEMINAELAKIGMPENLIQILGEQSRENTRNLISAVDVVIATGGMGMVHAAYSSGRPALGVGAGNVQCIIDRGVDYKEAVPKIITGRAFDNGIICSGEQSVICPSEDFDVIMKEFEANGGFVVRDAPTKEALRNAIFVDGVMNRHAIGQDVQAVAKLAKIEIPKEIKVIVVEADGAGESDILAKEKMCPIIAAYKYDDFKEGVEIARENLEREGKGHSVSLHSNNKENIEYAGEELCVSRFVINQVCASSAGGSFYNGLAPTNTLGCGTWGHNSISENLDYKHLINISRIAYFMPDNHIPSDEELWSL